MALTSLPQTQKLSAVVLAAGMGTRLKDIIDDRPKGLLEIGGDPLIKFSLDCLQQNGIDDVVMVTGYKEEQYKQFLHDKYPNIAYVTNEDYSVTGSMHSLFLAQKYVRGSFVLLESDLLYERRAISILKNRKDSTVLISGPTYFGDEVYIYGDSGIIRKITKKTVDSLKLQGELVGISKISLSLYEKMCAYYQSEIPFPSDFHYEDCISGLSKRLTINYCKVEDLAWTEIDDPTHYHRAVESVYPRILKHNLRYR